MAVGDAVLVWSSVASNALLAATPTTGVEWVIHNIYTAATGSIDVHMCAATTAAVLSTITCIDSSVGPIRNLRIHLTNSIGMAIRNTSGCTMYVGYDGMVTK